MLWHNKWQHDWNGSKILDHFKKLIWHFVCLQKKNSRKLKMPSYLLIRKFENSDEFKCQEVIKEFVMSGAKDAFFDGLFREVKKIK